MRLETFLLILGLLVFFEPHFGIPLTWKTALSTVLGVFIVLVSVIVRYRSRARRADGEMPVYVEHAPMRSATVE